MATSAIENGFRRWANCCALSWRRVQSRGQSHILHQLLAFSVQAEMRGLMFGLFSGYDYCEHPFRLNSASRLLSIGENVSLLKERADLAVIIPVSISSGARLATTGVVPSFLSALRGVERALGTSGNVLDY